MCLIIDANVLAEFFGNEEFKPALKWVRDGSGKIIIGGSKYDEEIKRVAKAVKVLVELRKAGRVVRVPDETVDSKQVEIEKSFHIHSDDPHIIALVIESCCRVVCTRDGPLQQDFRDRFREKFNVRRPSVYKRKQHAGLLCQNNVVAICC